MIGKKLGRYRIIEKIGGGGMGDLYKAYDDHLKRDVAIKVISADKIPDEKSKNRFRKEALALSRLSHPNIATIHDLDIYEDKDFIVMEYVPGMTLLEKLKNGPMNEEEIVSIGKQLSGALKIAHKEGVIHRDLKPDNIMILPDGRIKILDFGVAKLLNPSGVTVIDDSVSRIRTVAGTPAYMSPEQLLGQRVDHESDLFSLGIVIYEMITGENPFRDMYSDATAYKTVQTDPPPPSTIRKDISGTLEKTVMRLLQKDPINRFRSAEELEIAFNKLEQTLNSPSSSFLMRKRTLGGMGILAAAAIVIISIYQIFAGEIYSSEAPTQVVRRLTFTGKADIPIMSPDGKNIAYYESGKIYLKPITGGTARPIETRWNDIGVWAWCPDGMSILAHTWDPELKKLIIVKLGLYGEEPQILAENAMQPDMSADGRELLYTRYFQNAYSIMIMEMASGKTRLIKAADEPGTSVYKSCFSPDGEKISYTKWDGYGHKIWVINKDGSNDHEINTAPIQLQGKYCWTKDSRSLLIAGQLHGIWSIWKINTSGTGHIRMTSGSEKEMHVTRSPDGSCFVFGKQQDLSRIAIIDINESEVNYPFELDIASKHPAYSSDGSKIYFQALVNEQWQIWSALLNSDEPPKPAITKNTSCGWPIRGKNDNLLYIQSEVARPRLWGKIKWSTELWSSRPDGGIQNLQEAPGKHVKRIAPSSFRSDNLLYTELSDVSDEVLYVVTPAGERTLVLEDNAEERFSSFDWGKNEKEVYISHVDTTLNSNYFLTVSSIDLNNMKRKKLFSADTLKIGGSSSEKRMIFFIALSPDKRNLAFVIRHKGGGSHEEMTSIYRFDIKDEKVIRIVDFPSGTYPEHLAWAPDSKHIAVEISRYKSDIYISEPSEDFIVSKR